jgi:hypothetical protein
MGELRPRNHSCSSSPRAYRAETPAGHLSFDYSVVEDDIPRACSESTGGNGIVVRRDDIGKGKEEKEMVEI